jgi:phenylacetate-CoA ligase
MTTKERIFQSAEKYAEVLAHIPAALRVGSGYLRESLAVRRAERWDTRTAEARLLPKLQQLLLHAATQVPFYREFYRDKGYAVQDFRTLGDWKRVPVVTKQDLQKYPLEARCTPNAKGPTANTGGTSGSPLAFRLERNATPVEWAHMHHIWSAHGYHVSHLKLRLGGTYFSHGEPLSFHPRHNEYVVNANCPMPDVVDAVLELSDQKLFRWLHGYPSLVAEFAHALAARRDAAANRFVAHLRGALLGSEFPAPVYREPIARVLTANIVSWYGHSEMALLARETAEGVYQSLPTYGYAEAVSADGGGGQRLVCTSLYNRVHPFVRYDTGDRIAEVFSGAGSLAFRIEEGRIGDFVIDRAGRNVSLTSIIFGRHHAAFNEVLHLQVRQTHAGHMSVLVVPRSLPCDAKDVMAGFDFAGVDIGYDVQVMDHPIRTRSGKLKLKIDP